jgi:hypothetical protein
MPETLSDSSTSVEMSAIVSWRLVVIFLRSAPTRLVRKTNSGSRTRLNAARRQSSRNIATTVASTVVRFETMLVAVFVTTFSTPPMSLAIRDCTSPVRVFVKNARLRRWRWRYTAERSSCMTRCPTLFERYVCATPSAPVAIAIAIIPATSAVRRVVSRSGMAVSSTLRRRKGEIIPSPALRKIRPSTAPSRLRCALNSPPTRLRL